MFFVRIPFDFENFGETALSYAVEDMELRGRVLSLENGHVLEHIFSE
jgi:hypothetical protein